MNVPTFVLLILILVTGSPLIYLVGRLGRDRRRGGSPAARWLALIVQLAAWVPFVMAARDVASGTVPELTLGMISLVFDGLALLLAALALVLGTLVTLYSTQYMAGEEGEEKYFAMLTAMIGVMVGLGCAVDLFNLWVWFETMAITSYLLVAFYREQPQSLEAGVKYLMQSAIGSVLVLIGIALVLMQTGTLDLREIAASVTPTPLLLAAGALFVAGFGVKAALVPLHTWLPDAHSQAPSGISAMLSGVVIEAGLIALLRSLGALTALDAPWGAVLMVAGALNMVIGNLMALRQKQVKRLLAFSSLTHMGYMLVGIGAAMHVGLLNGAQGGMFHVLTHGLMKGLAFLAAGAMLYILHAVHSDHDALLIDDLNGAGSRYPLVAFTLSVALLALGGLPPLAGFMSKWQIFVAGFESGDAWLQALVIFAALNSVLSLGYYAPLINAMYRKAPSEAVQQGPAMPVLLSIPLGIMVLGVLALGLWPNLLAWLTEPAGQVLLTAFGG